MCIISQKNLNENSSSVSYSYCLLGIKIYYENFYTGLSILFLIVMSGCGTVDYSGIYAANHNYGADTLEVYENFTYRQHYIAKDGKDFINKGRWELIEDRVGFENFVWHIPGFGRNQEYNDQNKGGFWPASYEKSFFFFRPDCFVIDEDAEFYYYKVK